MSFLDHIHACNNFDRSAFRSFDIGGKRFGWVRHDNAERLTAYPDVFEVSDTAVALRDGLDGFEARSQALAPVVEDLASKGVIPGIRHELYPISDGRHRPPLLQIERMACPLFGVRTSGVHMNGYVRKASGLHMWVARRARDKMTYPGMLDNMVAGGQPIGLGLMENLIKECGEEAGIPAAIARRALPVGLIVYDHQTEDGAKPDRQYVFDLELPEDFTPVPADGEVEEFMLWPIETVAAKVRDTFEFKFNCNLAIIDFLIRHSFLDPDTESDYEALCDGLRRGSAL